MYCYESAGDVTPSAPSTGQHCTLQTRHPYTRTETRYRTICSVILVTDRWLGNVGHGSDLVIFLNLWTNTASHIRATNSVHVKSDLN